MRLLFLCDFYTGYVIQLWEYLKKYHPDLRISLLTNSPEDEQYRKALRLEEGEEIYAVPKSFCYITANLGTIRKLPEFDIIQPLWMEKQYGVCARSLKNKTKHIYISVGGSDLYRRSKKRRIRLLQMRLIKYASVVSSENRSTREDFYRVYGDWTRKIPHYITRFGVDIIDSINEHQYDLKALKRNWNIPDDKLVIMLGHNGSKAHQHLDMIRTIGSMDRGIIDKCFFVIPMTYGTPDEEYKSHVKAAISQLTKEYVILESFLNVDQMAEITVMTDVMIHVQTTDQLSSTMMAHLYNGNVVLAGSWLPYSDIKKKGIKLYDVDGFEDLGSKLQDVVENISEYKNTCEANKQKVYEFSSWEYCIRDWYNIYDNLINGKVKEDR